MNSSLLERFQRCCLGMGQPRFGAALGKSPPPAATSLDQQELDARPAHPVADRSDLFAFAQFAKLRQSNEPGGWLTRPSRRPHNRQIQVSRIAHTSTHCDRVHDCPGICLEPTLVLDGVKTPGPSSLTFRWNLSAYLHPAGS